MYIIHRGANDSLTFYNLQRTVFENGQLKAQMQVETRALDYNPDLPPSISTQEVLVPNDALAPNLEASVANWLVSPAGPLKGGFIVSNELFPLERERHDLLRRVKMLRNLYDYGTVMTPHGRVDSDQDSQRKIVGAVTMALLLDTQFVVPWRMSDNTTIVCDKQKMIDIGLAVGFATTQCQQNKNYLDDLIMGASSIGELAVIDIGNGWPGTPPHAEVVPEEEPVVEPEPEVVPPPVPDQPTGE